MATDPMKNAKYERLLGTSYDLALRYLDRVGERIDATLERVACVFIKEQLLCHMANPYVV